MQAAIDEARDGIYNGDGGPFGSVIVKDGAIVARGHNRVLANADSTDHGEMVAIRNAERAMGTADLSGCTLYTTGEPCPMCLAACMWANIDHVYFGCTLDDSGSIGFRDARFDELMGGRENVTSYLEMIERTACLALFEEYGSLEHTLY
jgi:guanine deaminase